MTTTVIDLLQVRAAKLGLKIIVRDDDEPLEPDLDFGPFMLCSREDDKDYYVWPHGLPLEGIADAINCFERELRGDIPVEDAWRDFGTSWVADSST